MPKRKSSRSESDERLPLRLTPHQREALVTGTRLRPQIKRRLSEAGEGPQAVGFTKPELARIYEEVSEAAQYASGDDKKRLLAVRRKLARLVEPELAGPLRRRPVEGDLVCQFRVTLLEVEPPVWRRVQVRDGTLASLHEVIQTAMGWEDRHLHRFEIDGLRYGPADPGDFDLSDQTQDEAAVLVSGVLPRTGRRTRFFYEYDFGDRWRHEVIFEGFPPPGAGTAYPLCLEGERACPPEDVGGPVGYAEFLDALADPEHDRHEESVEWAGGFDPEAFSAEEVNERLKPLRAERTSGGRP